MATDVVFGRWRRRPGPGSRSPSGGRQRDRAEKLAAVGGSQPAGWRISATGTRQKPMGIEDSKESWMALWKERQAIAVKTRVPGL